MTEGEKPILKTARELFPMDRLIIDYHALSRFQLRQGVNIVEAAEQLRARVSDSVLLEFDEKGPAVKRLGGKKSRRRFPQYVLKDMQDPKIRYVVRRNERGVYFLATTYSVKKFKRKKF